MRSVEATVIEQIKEICAIKGVTADNIDANSPVDERLGLDSLDFAELAVRLEGIFGRDPFAEGEVPNLSTVADLAALYDQKSVDA